ncbi:MAG: hypothetical protein ACE5HV_10810 [Acidobacteriota bacterium]
MRSAEVDLLSLRDRIEWLEVQNHRMRIWAGVGVFLVAVALWLMQPAAGQTVEAQQFVLDDTNGTRRAEFSVVMEEPLVTLYDAQGKIRGAFRIGADGKPEYQIYPGRSGPALMP